MTRNAKNEKTKNRLPIILDVRDGDVALARREERGEERGFVSPDEKSACVCVADKSR